MVWIHGGAYTVGSGMMYDGSKMAAVGDVIVGNTVFSYPSELSAFRQRTISTKFWSSTCTPTTAIEDTLSPLKDGDRYIDLKEAVLLRDRPILDFTDRFYSDWSDGPSR
jgi:hypothetical protein